MEIPVKIFTIFEQIIQVLVCAHRYISQIGESQHGQGLCYVLSNELKYDETYEPCKGRSTTRAHEDYGFCQVGTSGTILEDDTMVLGTPGPYTWRGTVFVISVGGEYLKRDKIHYYGPHLDQTSPVDKYSYLGKERRFLKYTHSQQYLIRILTPTRNGCNWRKVLRQSDVICFWSSKVSGSWSSCYILERNPINDQPNGGYDGDRWRTIRVQFRV